MDIKAFAQKVKASVATVLVGNEAQAEVVLAAVLAGGHVLLEDKPGTGKTMMAKSLARSVDGQFKRVQFTPDLMPADITGLNIYNKKNEEFNLIKGPVFTNILLADEINRATPRTQSALLEAMEERQVTIDGTTYRLEEPFVVVATENPVETTGTYPLPEAQLDRFMVRLAMADATTADEINIMERFMEANPLDTLAPVVTTADLVEAQAAVKSVRVHICIREYIAEIISATRTNAKISLGASTRGTLALLRISQAYAAIQGRAYVIPDDVRYMAPYVLAHRVIMVGHGNAAKERQLIAELVGAVKVPVEDWEK